MPANAPETHTSHSATSSWEKQLLLFVATTLSVFYTGAMYAPAQDLAPGFNEFHSPAVFFQFLAGGWMFALPLLAILLFHEFGHWLAARYHGVPASLPFFIPLPLLSPFGTMGAVITMPERIKSRNALLDIGAAGPLAGLVVTIPALIIGLRLSSVGPLPEHYVQEGQSLLYYWIKFWVLGEIPAGHDVHLHPTAFAAWAGLFVTMINLVPWGQLDGGHVAFALFGQAQHQVARWVRIALVALFIYNLWVSVGPSLRGSGAMPIAQGIGNSLFWLSWYILTSVLGRFFGHEHPPFEPGALSPSRRLVALVTLVLFVLLFMPTPFAHY